MKIILIFSTVFLLHCFSHLVQAGAPSFNDYEELMSSCGVDVNITEQGEPVDYFTGKQFESNLAILRKKDLNDDDLLIVESNILTVAPSMLSGDVFAKGQISSLLMKLAYQYVNRKRYNEALNIYYRIYRAQKGKDGSVMLSINSMNRMANVFVELNKENCAIKSAEHMVNTATSLHEDQSISDSFFIHIKSSRDEVSNKISQRN